MAYRLQRWMTRDFVFTAPPAFPDVVALQPERFDLRPYPRDREVPSLFVLVLDRGERWDVDESFAPIAVDLLGAEGSVGWSLAPVQVLGREGRYGTGSLSSAKAGEEAAGLMLVRGRGNRVWAFGWRSAASDPDTARRGFDVLMQGLQARIDDVSEKMLLSQYHGQEKKRRAAIEAMHADDRRDDAELDPADSEWDQRFTAALGESQTSAAAHFFAEAVSLVEEPYGEEVPLGASRIGGGPDLPPDVWPSNGRGMRHPFLLQINLAEVTATCGSMGPLPEDGLLSFFVHDDALLVDVVYTPPGAPLVRYPMTEAIIEASSAAVIISAELDPNTPPGTLPHTEGDLVTAELMTDGTLKFAHTPDPVWAVGEPGERFEALSDRRWAGAAYVRLRPRPTRTFDASAAETQIEERDIGSLDELTEIHEAFERAQTGPYAGAGAPQVHQMLGHAMIQGGQDCRREASKLAVSQGFADLDDPDRWIVLVRLRAGSATGRVFWNANDLVIMAPTADVESRRFDRCVLLSG
jgi:hypothetical protein